MLRKDSSVLKWRTDSQGNGCLQNLPADRSLSMWPAAVPVVFEPTMFQGIEHTAIATSSPERLAQWYVDVLDFQINYRYGPFVFAKAPNGSMIEFIPSEGETPSQAMRTPGIRHIAIAVDDFDQAHAELAKKGVRWVGESSTSPEGNRLAFFEDGDGNYLHIIQRAQAI